MTSTWEWLHVGGDHNHEPNPDWYGIREQEEGDKLEAPCIDCDRPVVAHGSEQRTEDPVPRPGRWTVDDGRPYWVDTETSAHYHPNCVQDELNWITSRFAWSELADAIWTAEHPHDVHYR